MSWIAVGVGAGVGLLNGAMSSQQQAKNQKESMLAQAAQTRYSPWTGASIQTMHSTAPNTVQGALNGTMQGGLTGGLMSQQLAKTKKTDTAAQAPDPSQAQVNTAAYTNPWTGMSAQQQPNFFAVNPYSEK